jgi:hypothetical protein
VSERDQNEGAHGGGRKGEGGRQRERIAALICIQMSSGRQLDGKDWYTQSRREEQEGSCRRVLEWVGQEVLALGTKEG